MLNADSQDHERLIAPLYRFSPRFWGTVALLLALIAPGAVLYVRQLTLGLGVTSLDRPAFWGVYLVNFIFLIGVSMAGTLISAALHLLGVGWRRPITRMAEALTVFGLLIAGLQIIIDMGRPDRLLAVFRYGRFQSPLLWDVLSLSVYLLTAMFALYLQLLPDIARLRDTIPLGAPAWRRWLYTRLALNWRGNNEQWRRLERAITVVSVLIIPIGVSLHTVTSWIFSTTVQPGWKSTILGPYFVVGAVFSGIGLLFVVASLARRFLGLADYIKPVFYKNLGWLFIVMNAVWFYFTLNEVLVIVAEQETLEFPVMASKLWGDYAPSFWGMAALMLVAFWIMVGPKLLPAAATRLVLFRPRPAFALAGAGAVMVALVTLAPFGPALAALGGPQLATSGLIVGLALLVLSGLLLTAWLKQHPVTAAVIAGVFVLVGMWLERWNIILPTVTHPRLIPYSVYAPSLTELVITLSSAALFALMFVIFFKLFPPVSIWEVAAGRALETAKDQTVSPAPRSPFTFGRRGK